MSEKLLLWDAQVFQSRAGLPPFQSYSFTLLQHVFHLGDVRCETKTLEGCGAKTGGESEIITHCGVILGREMDTPPAFPCALAVVQRRNKRGPRLTVDDMLRRYGLLVGLVAYFIGF